MTETTPTPLSPELLAILVCPVDYGDLTLVADGKKIRCRTCGRSYPIREGIPVMLVDEAEMPAAEGNADA